MKLLILLLIFSIGSFQYGASEESKSLNFQQLVVSLIGKFDSAVGTGGNIKTVFEAVFGGSTSESQGILSTLDTIKSTLGSMKSYISTKLDNIENILLKLEKGEHIRTMRSNLAFGIQTVNEAWRRLSQYKKDPKGTEARILQRFVDDYEPKLLDFIELQKRISPTAEVAVVGAESLPVLLANDMNLKAKEICGIGASAQQYLMNLFITILDAEVKTTSVLTFIAKLKYRRQEWSSYKSNLQSNYLIRYEAYIREFSKAFELASREFRPCDPAKWVKDVSYIELEKFNQATMFRAPQDWIWPGTRDCDTRAATMNNEKATRICQSNLVDCYDKPAEVCHGTLTSCFKTGYAERCVLKGQTRRYTWIKPESNTVTWGRPQDGCKGGDIVPSNTWPYCMCHCLEGVNKVSLEMATSNLRHRRIVTAVRWAKKNNVLFIQIQEGNLGPEGTISESFNEWKPSSPTTDSEKLVTFDSIEHSFNVGEIKGAHNEVIAGIGLTRAEESSGKRLKLEALVIKFQYSTGLILGRRHIKSSNDTANDVHAIGDLNSVRAVKKTEHEEDSLPGHYERFYRTDLKEDAGQTTVPLFDATPVRGDPVTPLSGIGLFHKGVPNYAGFLAFKAIAVDTSYFFQKYYLNRLGDGQVDADM